MGTVFDSFEEANARWQSGVDSAQYADPVGWKITQDETALRNLQATYGSARPGVTYSDVKAEIARLQIEIAQLKAAQVQAAQIIAANPKVT